MFHHFVGRLVEKSPAHAVVECGGVGYFPHFPDDLWTAACRPAVTLLAHAVYREDAQLLLDS